MRATTKRVLTAVGFGTLVLIGVLLVQGHRVRALQNSLPPEQVGQPLRIGILTSTPLGSTSGQESCAAPGQIVLYQQRWLPLATTSREATPLCSHLAGWQGRASKCLLEFPSSRDLRGYLADGGWSGVASSYYRLRYGGLLYFTAAESDHLFLMLDRRWCQWADVGDGLRLALGGAS